MSRFDLGQRPGYCAFLAMHHAALLRLDRCRRVEDSADFDSMKLCLRRDLGTLGVLVRDSPSTSTEMAVEEPPVTSDALGQLGVAYVVRGSRLGSQILRRRVAAGFPTAYLDFVPLLSWPQFLCQLDGTEEPGRANGDCDVIRGARAAFAVFAAFSQGVTPP